MAGWERKQRLVNSFDSSSSTEEQNKLAAQCFSENVECFELISFVTIVNSNNGQKDALAMMLTAFDLLLKYATNLLSSKRSPKWRAIPITSGNFKARIDCMNGARDILKLIGYCEETPTSMKFPDNVLEPDRPKVSLIAAELLIGKVGIDQMLRGVDWIGAQHSRQLDWNGAHDSRQLDWNGAPDSRQVDWNDAQDSRQVDWSGAQHSRQLDWNGPQDSRRLDWNGAQDSTLQGGLPHQGPLPPASQRSFPAFGQDKPSSTSEERMCQGPLPSIDEGRCLSFDPPPTPSSHIPALAVPQSRYPVPKPRRNTSFITQLDNPKIQPSPEMSSLPGDKSTSSLPGDKITSSLQLDSHIKKLAEIRAQRESIKKSQSNHSVSCQIPMIRKETPAMEASRLPPSAMSSAVIPEHLSGGSPLGPSDIKRNIVTPLGVPESVPNTSAALSMPSSVYLAPFVPSVPVTVSSLSYNSAQGSRSTSSCSSDQSTSVQNVPKPQPIPKPRKQKYTTDIHESRAVPSSISLGDPGLELKHADIGSRNPIYASQCGPMPPTSAMLLETTIKHGGKERSGGQTVGEGQYQARDGSEASSLGVGTELNEKVPGQQRYKDALSGTLKDKKAARREFRNMRQDMKMKAEPVVNCDPINEEKKLSHRKGLEEGGKAMLLTLKEMIPLGHSPDEIELVMKEAKTRQTRPIQTLNTWNEKIRVLQNWVSVYDTNYVVGLPSIAETKQFMLKHGGVLEMAVKDCYQDRRNKITSVMNKMKPFMEVPWEAAKAALCDCDMNVEKAVWALQRDGLGLLYEFINSEQEWAKVKQSDMGEIKELLRGGGWTDNQSPLRLLVGECKFEDTERANVVIQLMNKLEQGGRGCELQFYIDAAKEHQTLEKAMNYLNVECPICIVFYLTHEMVLMPGCPHSVCKECFKGHFTNVMKTQSVKHFNCPVCALPDMTDPQIETYLMLLMQLVKMHIDKEGYDLCQQKLVEFNLSKEPNFCWCANDKCHAGFINETGRDKIVCPTCKKEMCFKCKKPWEREHEGLTCDKFAQWKHDNDPQLQQQGLAAHLEANGIECPACHFRYDLARGGCMHFKCTQCPNEFCSGCGQAFKQQCKRLASCAKRGLHAHHPRDCLFFLRDFSIQDLQGFLEKNNVQFDKEPPKAQLKAAALDNEDQKEKKQSLKCCVMLQKETADGLKDEPCGTDSAAGCAGLCEVHYKEYLVGKLNNSNLDPISLYAVNQLQAMLIRDDKEVPPKEEDEDENEYSKRLVKYVEEELPLDHK